LCTPSSCTIAPSRRLTALGGCAALRPSLLARDQDVDHSCEREGEKQVQDRPEHQPGAVEDLGLDVAPRLGELDQAEEGDQRRVLHERDVVVEQRRDHLAHRLRDDHVAHRLAVAHPEGSGGLHLAPGDGLDPGPVDLSHVRAIRERQRGDPVPERRRLPEPGRADQLAREDLSANRRAEN
jgi:hypothetical protein